MKVIIHPSSSVFTLFIKFRCTYLYCSIFSFGKFHKGMFHHLFMFKLYGFVFIFLKFVMLKCHFFICNIIYLPRLYLYAYGCCMIYVKSIFWFLDTKTIPFLFDILFGWMCFISFCFFFLLNYFCLYMLKMPLFLCFFFLLLLNYFCLYMMNFFLLGWICCAFVPLKKKKKLLSFISLTYFVELLFNEYTWTSWFTFFYKGLIFTWLFPYYIAKLMIPN